MDPATADELDAIIAGYLTDAGPPLYVCFNNQFTVEREHTRALGPAPVGTYRPAVENWFTARRRENNLLEKAWAGRVGFGGINTST